jgi:hypothetical protein
MNFTHPFFWRHFAAYTAGAVLVLVGLFGPQAAAAAGPFTGFMVIGGAGLLAVAGTRILGRPPAAPPDAGELASSERPTPPSGPAKAA